MTAARSTARLVSEEGGHRAGHGAALGHETKDGIAQSLLDLINSVCTFSRVALQSPLTMPAPGASGVLGRGRNGALDRALREPAGNPAPDPVRRAARLEGVVDVGIVVDLDHVEAAAALLDVGAVKPLSHAGGGLERQRHGLDWRVREGERLDRAFAGRFVAMIDDLPVARRHVI